MKMIEWIVIMLQFCTVRLYRAMDTWANEMNFGLNVENNVTVM